MLRYGLVLVYSTFIAIYGVLSPKLSDSSIMCLIWNCFAASAGELCSSFVLRFAIVHCTSSITAIMARNNNNNSPLYRMCTLFTDEWLFWYSGGQIRPSYLWQM